MQTDLDTEYDWLLSEFQQSVDEDARTGSRSNRTVALKLRIEAILRKHMESTVTVMAQNVDPVATSRTLEPDDLRPKGVRH